MELCSYNHDEVAFSERKCPVCQLRDDLEEKIRELTERIESSESETKDAESNAENYKARWIEANQEVERLCNGRADGER